MTDKEKKDLTPVMDAKAVKALEKGEIRRNIGGSAIEVGMTITIPADSKIVLRDGKANRNGEQVDIHWLAIEGTAPELSLSTFLAMPPTSRSIARWHGDEDDDDYTAPTIEEVQEAVSTSYQPKSRDVTTWAVNEFPALRGKSVCCTHRWDYVYGTNDFNSKYLTFEVVAAKANNKKKKG